jgi:hypothetical protein
MKVSGQRFTAGTHWIGRWVYLRPGQDTKRLQEKFLASAGDRTPVV